MHLVLSWDIKVDSEDSEEWSQANEALKECIKNHDWIKPLKNFYIVKVDSQIDFELLRSKLQSKIMKYPGKINYIMSPLMVGGKYLGWLPKSLWPKIRSKTE